MVGPRAALALKGTGKLPVAVLGDGEMLLASSMGSIQALWTAAHHRIPGVWLVENNLSYSNVELHQHGVAWNAIDRSKALHCRLHRGPRSLTSRRWHVGEGSTPLGRSRRRPSFRWRSARRPIGRHEERLRWWTG